MKSQKKHKKSEFRASFASYADENLSKKQISRMLQSQLNDVLQQELMITKISIAELNLNETNAALLLNQFCEINDTDLLFAKGSILPIKEYTFLTNLTFSRNIN